MSMPDMSKLKRSSASQDECAFLPSIQKGTRVLISLWDSLMLGRVPKNAAFRKVLTSEKFSLPEE